MYQYCAGINSVQIQEQNPEMGYSTYSKLYENCVVPILDYASGVRGYQPYPITDQLQKKAQIQYIFKFFLGVHRFVGVEGDMGWLNRGSQRYLNMLRLWNRLIGRRENRLPKAGIKNEYNNGNKNWC